MSTFNGGSGSDSFQGKSHRDHAYGYGGDDFLSGGSGGDTLDGGDGDDILFSAAPIPGFGYPYAYYGGPLDTGAEHDKLRGGAGDDVLFAGYGDDVDGGEGGDRLIISFMGASSGVTADFQQGSLTVGGGKIQNIDYVGYVQGSDFDDAITMYNRDGYANLDTVHGMAGNDQIKADYYSDALYGDDGNDVLDCRPSGYLSRVDGGAGDDIVYANYNPLAEVDGGDGNDIIYSGGATVHGGAGGDDIFLQESSYGGFAFGDGGNDLIKAATNTRAYIFGGTGADHIIGSAGDDVLGSAAYDSGTGCGAGDGDRGHDVLNAGAGSDIISAGYGDDVDGGTGDDLLYVLDLGGATEGVTLDLANLLEHQPFQLGGGTIQGIESVLSMIGTDYADTIMGSSSEVGMIEGGGGDDHISGGSLGQIIEGGAGFDVVSGGTGADTFRFLPGDFGNTQDLSDEIKDFLHSDNDRIDLSAIDADSTTREADRFNFIGSGAFDHQAGELRYAVRGDTALLMGDTNGDGVADFSIRLDHVSSLDPGDLIL